MTELGIDHKLTEWCLFLGSSKFSLLIAYSVLMKETRDNMAAIMMLLSTNSLIGSLWGFEDHSCSNGLSRWVHKILCFYVYGIAEQHSSIL